jgi:predicted double-glycine peptidase
MGVVNPWLEPLLALFVSLAAVAIGFRAQPFRWTLMSIGIGGVIFALVAANGIPRRVNGYLLSAAVPLVTAPFYCNGVTRACRSGLAFATLLATSHSGWMEFISPALARMELAGLTTHMSPNGVCRQSTAYTCGPAAAVTALRRLGFGAEESEIAVLAHCSPHTGTDPSDLAEAIDQRFGIMGARVEYQPLNTLPELQQAGLALTVIRCDVGVDHWVAVLRVDERNVYYADPASGLVRMESRTNFEHRWEHETVRVWREDGRGLAAN